MLYEVITGILQKIKGFFSFCKDMLRRQSIKSLFFPRLLDRLAPSEGVVLLLLSIVVGAATGLAAVCFIELIALIHKFSYGRITGLFSELGRAWFIIIPVLGAMLSGPIIAFFASEAKGHGVPEVMQALILQGGRT